jgi:GntR family transcriptional regulator
MKKQSLSAQAKKEFLKLCENGTFTPGQRIPPRRRCPSCSGSAGKPGVPLWSSSAEKGSCIPSTAPEPIYWTLPIKIENDLSELRSLSDMIRNAGIVECEPEITITEEIPTEEIAQLLLLGPDEPVCVIKRTRYSESGVICSSVNYIPASLADELDYNNLPRSIFHYFEEKKGIMITRSSTRIVIPGKDDPIVSELLKIRDVSILGLKQLHFDSRGNPAMYSIDYLRCDLFDFSVTRTRQR